MSHQVLNQKTIILGITLTLAALAVIFIVLGVGQHWINPFNPSNAMESLILWDIRLPRILTAFAVGGMLALAGAWFQVLLGNPLAEPYVLGVAGSAAVGAVSAMMLFPDSTLATSIGAFIGAWVGIAAVLSFSYLGASAIIACRCGLGSILGCIIDVADVADV
ncbi:MAG: iron chelate uptake ABC transporter family permease subunit [Ghiorsea sp.]|nr:iron chelate uptake ABC transporter family permease subunit [Ghiorsea sp.]